MAKTEHPSPAGATGWLSGAARLGSGQEPKFVWLAAALTVLIVGMTFSPDDFLADVVLSASVGTVGLATLPLLPRRSAIRYGQLVLCAGAIAFVWLGPVLDVPLVRAFARLSLVGFFVSVAMWTLWHLARARRVTTETLVGAVSGYLLLGIAFALLFSSVEILHPGALRLGLPGDASPTTTSSVLLYFSFITLTTLGYGDITPASDGTRLLTVAEAVIGQFYIAAVVARLISLHVASPREGPDA